MRSLLMRSIAAAAVLGGAVGALAQPRPLNVARTGNVLALFADPSDVVIQLDVAGPCGSNLYHVRRSAPNFREMTEIATAAVSAGKRMMLVVVACPLGSPDRNLVSHGAVLR